MTTQTVSVEELKFLRRLRALANGRFLLTVTKENDIIADWTVIEAGKKIERPSKPSK